VPGCRAISLSASRRRRAAAIAATLTAALVLAACGGTRQDAGAPHHVSYPVQVTAASFPANQTLSQHTRMVITVRNAGNKTIPDLAITVCPVTCAWNAPKGEGTSGAVFDTNVDQDSLDSTGTPGNVPDWVVEQQPGPRPCSQSYSCINGGAGGYATQMPDTWAAGAVAPGASVTFDWHVVAVRPGHYKVAWTLAPALYGSGKVVLAGSGAVPGGTFPATISKAPAHSYVDNSGQIRSGSGQGTP
jgi:hypothetical protein